MIRCPKGVVCVPPLLIVVVVETQGQGFVAVGVPDGHPFDHLGKPRRGKGMVKVTVGALIVGAVIAVTFLRWESIFNHINQACSL